MFDIHSHVLPGIDDGSTDMAMSLDILRNLAAQGITRLICTPHYINETNSISPKSTNRAILKKLRAAAAKESIDIELYQGNEIYIDRNIAKLVKEGKICPLAEGNYLLVELPISGIYDQYDEILRDLVLKGWKIILAHPERYISFQNDYTIIIELAADGVLFQCNFGSFVGQYGRRAKRTAKLLAKDQLIFCLGSDSHRPHHPTYIAKAKERLAKYCNEDEIRALLVENPAKIVQ